MQMQDLWIAHNRYDGAPLAGQLDVQLVQHNAQAAWVTLPLGDDDEFTLYFMTPEGQVDTLLLDNARSLLRALATLDNQVQDACAAACRRTGLAPFNFESELAYVSVFHDRALLHYYGARVNTEWDELVRREGAHWVYVGVAPTGDQPSHPLCR